MDQNPKIFIIYVIALKVEVLIYLLETTQIAALKYNKAYIRILAKY